MAVLGPTGYSVDSTLLVQLPVGGLTASIVATTNWPQGVSGDKGNFVCSVDEATSSKELILVSKNVNGVLTILQRGYANTTPVAHAAGATISVVDYDSNIQDVLFKNVSLIGLLYESGTDGIVATAGGGQANAALISTECARITSAVSPGDSVRLPPIPVPFKGALTIVVINHGGNSIQVFGTGTDTVNDQGATVGVTQMNNSEVIYTCTKAGVWYANGLGSGYAGSLPTVSYTDTITAKAGGGQALATQLVTLMNRVTVVASANDSVKLPVAVGGITSLVVVNASANALAVFPSTGDQINGAGANIVFSLAAGKTATFNAAGALNWHGVLSA